VIVRLRGVPARLHLASLAHLDDLLHELRIVRAGEETGQTEVAAELGDLMRDILDAYSVPHEDGRRQTETAVKEGRERLDIELDLPPEAATAGPALIDLLERADELARQQQLLTLAAPSEVAALRRWMNEEIAAQLTKGSPPSPCPL
jgi:hypothetical protein